MVNNISFKAKFRAVTTEDFYWGTIGCRRYFARPPWTVKESVRGVEAYTTGIIDCSVLGISNGQDVLLMHLCPSHPDNNDFKKIKDFILEKIDQESKNLKAAIFGSQDICNSQELNKNLQDLMKQLGIPCSIFKCPIAETDVMYSSIDDEWSVSSNSIDYMLGYLNSEEALKNAFLEIKLSHFDEIV